ncbi:hypothetical protein, partial [Streptomyces eurythermus]|uniref:hypothetical protein n=1 Tax=Streptomyces eurythermus TaxID=42237 RepID=UPI0033E7BB49
GLGGRAAQQDDDHHRCDRRTAPQHDAAGREAAPVRRPWERAVLAVCTRRNARAGRGVPGRRRPRAWPTSEELPRALPPGRTRAARPAR